MNANVLSSAKIESKDGFSPDLTPELTPELNALEQLKALVADDFSQVNERISNELFSDVPLIQNLARHVIAAGGKRIRPLLTLACANLAGYNGDRHINLAAIVEFIHTATLLHDDVIDESMLRRGQETANAVWGNEASVLVGDFLFAKAFELMVGDGSLEVLQLLSSTSARITEGEIQQLEAKQNLDTPLETYLTIIEAKTAVLFAAACKVGGILGDLPNNQQQALYDYGLYLGYAFQIADDLLDYMSREESIGKTVGDDFAEGKITYPVLKSYEIGTAEEKAFWHRCIGQMDQSADDLARAIELINKHNAIDLGRTLANDYVRKAQDSLKAFEACDLSHALNALSTFCVKRLY